MTETDELLAYLAGSLPSEDSRDLEVELQRSADLRQRLWSLGATLGGEARQRAGRWRDDTSLEATAGGEDAQGFSPGSFEDVQRCVVGTERPDALQSYLDGRLTEGDVWRVEMHLAFCAACRRVFLQRTTVPNELPRDVVWGVVSEALTERIRGTPARSGSRATPLRTSRFPHVAFAPTRGEDVLGADTGTILDLVAEIHLARATLADRLADPVARAETDHWEARVALLQSAGEHLERARELLETVVEGASSQGLPTAWNDLAVARHALGEEEAALEALDRALELDSARPEALFNRGMLRAERGETEGARTDLEAFLALAGEDEDERGWVAEAKAELALL